MQKKLLTLAVAGALAAPALAVAQSTVEVYGTVAMSFGQFRYSEGTAGQTLDGAAAGAGLASVSKFDVASHGSNYGVRSRENLGGGLAGWIQIENNAPMERSNNIAITPASRNSAIGLQGGFGNVFMGQWTTPWSDLDALWSIGTAGYWGPALSIMGRRETTGVAPNPNCVNGISPGAGICDAVEGGGGVGHPFWRRFSNAVFYQSPVMGGVQVKLAYQTNEGKATGTASSNADPSAWSSSVQWSGMGGRARVGVAYDRHKDFTSIGAADTGYAIKGGWNFGVVDLGLGYEVMKYKCQTSAIGATPATGLSPSVNAIVGACAEDGDIKAKQYVVALAVPVGAGSIRAAYAVAKDLEGPITSAGAVGTAGTRVSNTGAKQYNIGYEHRFSKRTLAAVGYAKIDNKANAGLTWTGAPPNQGGASNNPLFGSDVSTFFVSLTHRF